jgi:hypothetical protein
MKCVRKYIGLTLIAVLSVGGFVLQVHEAVAQPEKCTTTAECAQQAVDAAARAEAAVKVLESRLQHLEDEIATIKKFAPYSFTAKGCAVGREIGVLFALHDSNLVPPPPTMGFSLSGQNVAGLEKHEWAELHVCTW